MLRSMYAGISGMKVNQTKLDVLGNNIANSGTIAFKGSRVRFQDMLSQNESEAVGPSRITGGVNGKQVGLGVNVAGIDNMMQQGMMQPTGRNLDVGIDGEGYFIVGKGSIDGNITVDSKNNTISKANDMDVNFTRDGAFTLDNDGNLLTSDGYRVLGYSINSNLSYVNKKGECKFVDANSDKLTAGNVLQSLVIPKTVDDGGMQKRITSFSIEKDGLIKATLSDGKVTILGQIGMASFNNTAGLKKIGKNLYSNTANSGQAIIRTGVGVDSKISNSKSYGDMLQGMLEMSNVDLAEQFTDMIVASRAFQASGKMITTGDEILQDLINLKR